MIKWLSLPFCISEYAHQCDIFTPLTLGTLDTLVHSSVINDK